MCARNFSAAIAAHLSRRRISRVLAVVLSVSLLQITAGLDSPISYAAAGNVGQNTTNGTCSAAVGETTYVEATFVSNAFCLTKFNYDTTWTVPSGVVAIDILVVGGGGGGGPDGGGGGGGGEVRQATQVSVTAGNVATVAVGGGGARGYYSPYSAAGDGGISSVSLNALTYSAGGGKAGVGWVGTQSNAARGSGGTNGTAVTGGTNYSLGGYNATTSARTGATGYDGVTTNFTGPSMTFAGGGGGGICPASKTDANSGSAAGGAGGGGRGAAHTYNVGSDWGQPGTDFLGGGGGGGSACDDGGTNSSSGVTGNQRTPGGPGGRGVVYIKYVPLIYLASYPQSVTAAVGTTATFTSVPYGTIAATRTKKWQVLTPGGSWTDIAGATGSDSYTTPTITRSMHLNQYRYVVTDTYGTASSSTVSAPATLTVPGPVLLGETDTAISSVGTYYGNLSTTGSDEVQPSSSEAFTYEAWIYPTSTCPSTRCTILSRENQFRFTLFKGNISFNLYNSTSWGTWTDLEGSAIPINQWSHVALSRNGTAIKVFINGNQVASYTQTYAPGASAAYALYVGTIYGGSEYFSGSIDEVKIWKSDRSSNISTDMASNASSTSGLVGYWNFNEGTGSTSYNQVLTSTANTDFILYASNYWDSDVISTSVTDRAYSVKKFLRTYITATGGWKVPANVSKVSALVVAGGGGGGSRHAGGGGAGGIGYGAAYSVTPLSTYQVQIGLGGAGYGQAGNNSYGALNYKDGPAGGAGLVGGNSLFKLASSTTDSITAIGGGGGSGGTSTGAGGSGGGSNQTNMAGGLSTQYSASNWVGYGNAGGVGVGNTTCSSAWCGGGGGGAGDVGRPGNDSANGVTGPGNGGVGRSFDISGTATYYAGGGGGGGYDGTSTASGGAGGGGAGGKNTEGTSGTYATGGGGGGGGFNNSNRDYRGGNGGSGVVVVRWITAAKPIFTQPASDTTTAGLTDTITVSANPISPLTRNYLWQLSTDTGTTWANVSTGSGFTSQTYTTPVLETTTSGIRYQYRVIVTDSDTAGLFIYDTSTAVYITINPRIQISGSYTAQKYGASHTDTFTVISSTGTGNKIFTVSPNNRSGISWNVATANQATLTIAGSVGPGTYYDTMTATDTKGAQTQLSVAIVVSKADTLTVYSGTKFDTYTGTTLTFTPTFSITGLVNGDTATSVTYEYNGQPGTTYPKSTTKPINAGSYVITPTAVIPNSDSYTAVKVIPSALIVYRALRTISIDTLTSTLKYGSSASLSATPSAGSGDGTLTFSTAQTDSCTVATANLQAVKSSGSCVISAVISQGANYETATATTKTVTLAKADTITVQVRNPVTTVYASTGPTSLPTLTVSGLVLSDTATSTRLYSAPANGTTCATGGLCTVGDTGPGGGKVFYDAGSNQSWGRYLEAAPANWTGTADSATAYIGAWCVVNGVAMTNSTSIPGTVNGLGQGKTNTYLSALNQCTGGAIYLARQYRGGGLSDWYLPSSDELLVMGSNTSPNFIRTAIGMVYSASLYGYWGSDLGSANGNVKSLVTVSNAWNTGGTLREDLIHNMLRPIRAFAPSSSSIYNAVVNSSTVPTDVETYTVSASTLNFSVGSANDYQNIVYETSTLTITKANQTKLGINLYGAVAGSPFTLMITGGSGDGTMIYLVDGTGTGTNCAVSNGVLSNSNSATEQTSCSITITKAASRNYTAQSLSAIVYFMVFINDQPTQVGSGSTIGLNGVTSYTVDTTSPPTITSLSATTISIGAGGTFTINGTGFTGNVVVRFYRNKPVTPSSSSSTALTFNLAAIGSAGAATGRVTVITDNGQVVSTDTLVINP